MSIQLRNILKSYHSYKDQYSFTLTLPILKMNPCNLIGILGPSGCGKSTLLNLIALIDDPDSGQIIFNKKNVCKLSSNKKARFRNEHIGIVFQHYNLLEEHDVLYNIMLPRLIKRDSKRNAYKDACSLLESIKFPKNLWNAKCRDLSGGEKQRVALLRALINNPNIVLADEPTGALDEKNSVIVMNRLKTESKNKLVIVVTHNEKLIKQYADRIIEMKDGKVISDVLKNKIDVCDTQKQLKIRRHKDKWSNILINNNLRKRFKRNLISFFSLLVGLTSSLLLVGFLNGYKDALKHYSQTRFDYGTMSLTKEQTFEIENSGISITKQTKPTIEEIESLKGYLEHFYIEPDCSKLLSEYPIIKADGEIMEGVAFSPVYALEEPYVNTDLFLENSVSKSSSIEEVVINKQMYEKLKEINKEPLTIKLMVISSFQHALYIDNSIKPIVDSYDLSLNLKVVGVVDEMSFLSTPKIYYSYTKFESYISDIVMENFSEYSETVTTWFDAIENINLDSTLSSYSYKIFLKSFSFVDLSESIIKKLPTPFRIYSNGETCKESLFSLVDASTIGMEIFLVIAIIGSCLILGIVTFAAYSDDRKNSAILSCLGASASEISNVYFYESSFVGILSAISSFLVSLIFQMIINFIVNNILNINSIIQIPFVSFLGVNFLLPFLVFIASIFLCFMSSNIPIIFSKKISIKEELRDE